MFGEETSKAKPDVAKSEDKEEKRQSVSKTEKSSEETEYTFRDWALI
ncbi:MAG: hypothetical protein OXQ92_02030 [Boseongicola sp.]|nr:hypothetical protein [Boseongicola sp.]MDD9979290.1 hypothetical protein [Boseongicola sp.]